VIGPCHVNHTTGSGKSCECVCEEGWFKLSNTSSFYSSTLCSFCGGNGISFNKTTRDCNCTNHWTGVLGGCSQCEDPYGGGDCDRCNDPYNQSSYPSCDVCADEYFYDPSHNYTKASPSPACLSYEDCTIDFCSGTSANVEGIANATIVNKTCQCECNAGWFGEFSSILGNEHLWQACYYCDGHGVSFDGNSTCLECEYMWDPSTGCQYCSFPYDTITCDKCMQSRGNGQRFTPYPECHEYFSSSFDSATFCGIFFSCALIAFTVSYVFCKRLKSKEDRFHEATERISNQKKEAAYQRMKEDEKASEVVAGRDEAQSLQLIDKGALTITLDDITKA